MKPCVAVVSFALLLASCGSQSNSANSAGFEPRQLPASTAKMTGAVLSYASVVDYVAPAVVTIRSSRRVRAPQQFPFFDEPSLQRFFGSGYPQTQVEQALGSGVIVRPNGYILTNYHVIDGAQEIKVDLTTHHTLSAKVIGSDAPSDLAVLKIDESGLPVLELANSDQVRVGDVCLAVGNPLGIGETVTAGIISAKGRATGTGNGSFQNFLQTDAPINQGNSGGALVNTAAQLIGINSQILSTNGGNIGIGFAIPSNMANNVMDQLIGKGKVQRGMLGVGIQQLTPSLAAGLGLKESQGVLVNSVAGGGPAEKAGLMQGDVILKLNGKQVNDTNDLRNDIAGMPPGTDVTLTILRDGKQQDVHAKLGQLTAENARASQQQEGPGGESGTRLGISVAPLTPDIASQLGLPRGAKGLVIQQVDPNGPAAQAGLQAGDVIEQVNRQPVQSVDQMRNALQKSGNRPPLLLINRGGQTVFVPVPVQ